jgi:hypothetical protein
LGLHNSRLGSKPVAVAEEENAFAGTFSLRTGLNPLAPARTCPQRANEAEKAILGVGTIVWPHNLLDGLSSLIGVIERNGADVVVQDVCFSDTMHQLTTNETHFAVDGGRSTTHEVPLVGRVVRELGVGVLEEGDSN